MKSLFCLVEEGGVGGANEVQYSRSLAMMVGRSKLSMSLQVILLVLVASSSVEYARGIVRRRIRLVWP